MDCRLADSNVCGIFQERILECIAISFSKECRPTSAYSLMVCVLTLTFHLCIRSMHVGTQSCPRVSAQMVSLWKVPGRKSEAESQDFPTPHSPAQLRSPCIFTSITLESECPDLAPHQVPGTQVRYGSQENTPAGFRGLWPDSALQVRDLPPRAWADSLPIRIRGPSSCLSALVPMNSGQGGRPLPSCDPLPALHIWLRRRSSERMEVMSAALSAQPLLPPPCTDEETTGPRGQTGCGPWGAVVPGGLQPPLGFPTAVDSQHGAAPPRTWC